MKITHCQQVVYIKLTINTYSHTYTMFAKHSLNWGELKSHICEGKAKIKWTHYYFEREAGLNYFIQLDDLSKYIITLLGVYNWKIYK